MAGFYNQFWPTANASSSELQLADIREHDSFDASADPMAKNSHTPMLLLLMILCGVASHHAIFIHDEWHVQAPKLTAGFLAAAGAFTMLGVAFGSNIAESIHMTLNICTAFAAGIFPSIVLYRRFWHRLGSFDGPFCAGITKFWHVWQCLDARNFLVLDRLYQKYGSFVRTGPSEITCFLPDIYLAIDGPGSPCDKAIWYDLLLPELAVNTTRDRVAHDKRRRIWDKGFTNKALNEYQKRIVEYTHSLVQRIEEASAKNIPVDASVIFYWFTFDVMGEFAFGTSFRMLEHERWHYAVVLLRKAMRLLGPLTPVPWLAQIAIVKLPWFWVVKDWLKMLGWCRDRMRERMARGSIHPDVAHYLIEASEKNQTVEEDLPWLFGDAVTIIIAGSDTAAPTLVYGFYELALVPSRIDKLRQEVAGLDIYDYKDLEGCQYLNGFINEVLRLHPPVPTHGYRLTPSEGLIVKGTYIPGDVTIIAPRYTIGRLSSCFVDPEAFVPERWYSKPEMVKNSRAFRPFGQGRYGCVGKNLALRELRFVFALLVSKFNVRFAPGEDGTAVIRDMRDFFTAAPGRLKLLFEAAAVEPK